VETYKQGGNAHYIQKLAEFHVYSTYLGGSHNDDGFGIAVDSSGSVYVTGYASSSDFPTTPGAFQTSPAGASDAFVTELNPSGSALVYSTYLGGTDIDDGFAIAADSSGQACVAGTTFSNDFPTTPGAFQVSLPGSGHAFVTMLNPSGSALVYSTYLGGSTSEVGYGLAVDSSGNAYVTGWTESNDFPTTPGAFQRSLAGSADICVTKLNPRGSAPVYSTYIGGSSAGSAGASIAVDASGNAYVTGNTGSTNLPTTAGAFQTSLAGTYNAFVVELNPGGSALVYSTYLGGGAQDFGGSIGVDTLGNAYVAGLTTSANFPTTVGAFQRALAGSQNAFVAKFENSSQAQVSNLQSTVKNLVSTGTLNAGLGQFLLVPLDAALAAAYAGRTGAAVPDLDALIFDIRLLVILRRLTPTEGQTLINAANSLIAELRG
jgi:hypothetical protein